MWVKVFCHLVCEPLWVCFEKSTLNFAFIHEVLQFEGGLDVALASFGKFLVVDHAIPVTIRKTQEEMDLEGCQVDHFASFQSFFGLRDIDGCVILGVFLFELLKDLVL